MLTEPSPLDEGSSMGTNESGPIQAQASVDESSLMNDNDDWGVVTEAGVLILDGEEAEAPSLLPEGENGDQLSVPGTDSVPTIVGSIDVLPPAESTNTNENNNEVDAPKEEEETPPSDFEENSPAADADDFDAVCRLHSKMKWTMCVLLLSILLKGATTMVAKQARIDFLEDALNNNRIEYESLKQEVGYLSMENEQAEELKMENVVLRKQVEDLTKENEAFKLDEQIRWDTCQDQTVLMDNCWLTAKANVGLGDCGKHAKEAARDFSASLFEKLQNTSAAFVAAQESSVDEVEETVTKIIGKVDSLGKEFGSKIDSLGKALWKGMETKKAESKLNDFFSKMDDTGKSWFKDTVLGMFSEDKDATASSKEKGEGKSESLDDIVKGLSEMMNAGETFMAIALEKAADAMELNQTELLEAAKQAFEDASLAQHVSEK